jgi:glycosyl transferase family 25
MSRSVIALGAVVQKAKAVLHRGLPSLRNKIFAQFGYWPVDSVEGHWLQRTPVYCISLARAQERRSLIERQVSRMRLASFRFIDAVDAHRLTMAGVSAEKLYNSTETRRWHSRELTLNEIACSLSHLECYRQIVAAGHRWAIIIEDDALFLTRPFLSLRLSDIPDWAEIVFLNCFLDGDGRESKGETRVVDDSRYNGSSAGYMLSARTAERLLSEAPPVVHAADGLLGRALAGVESGENSFRGAGSSLDLKGVIARPQVILNGSTEHYTRTLLR